MALTEPCLPGILPSVYAPPLSLPTPEAVVSKPCRWSPGGSQHRRGRKWCNESVSICQHRQECKECGGASIGGSVWSVEAPAYASTGRSARSGGASICQHRQECGVEVPAYASTGGVCGATNTEECCFSSAADPVTCCLRISRDCCTTSASVAAN